MALALRFAEEGEFTSRAVGASYEDELEEQSAPPSSIFRWSKAVRARLADDAKDALSVDRLLVATKGSPQLFLERLTTSWHLIGTLIVSDESPQPLTLDPRRRPAACQILSYESLDDAAFGNTVAVIAPNDISNDAIWLWTQTLHRHIKAVETIVLDSQLSPIYDFGYGSDEAPMLRSLTSSAARDSKFDRLIPTLATPRFVTGITAALLTQGELRHQRVRAFISLRSSNSFLIESARSFSLLVSLLDLPSVASVDTASMSPLHDQQDEPDLNTLYT